MKMPSRRPARKAKRANPILSSLLWRVYLIAMIGLVIAPLLVALLGSFRSTGDWFSASFDPSLLTLENYESLFRDKHVLTYVKNSAITAGGGLLACILINPFIAYMIATNWHRRRYKLLYVAISSCMLIPTNMLVFPLVRMYYSIGLMNLGGVVLYYAVFYIPETVFLLVPLFRTVPQELYEAAALDGCIEWSFYVRVFFPITRPYVFVVMTLDVIWMWNDFFIPLMILNRDPTTWTLPIFIYNYIGRNTLEKNLALASSIIAIIPLAVLYLALRSRLLLGIGKGHV